MKSDDIVVRKEVGSGIHTICSKEVNPGALAIWVDSVEARFSELKALNQEKDQVISQHREVMARCVDTLDRLSKLVISQKTSVEELTVGLDTIREVLHGIIETQAQMQITKADRE